MRDQRTGRIGRPQYATLQAMIEQGKTANEIADALAVNPETIRKFARKRGLEIQRVEQLLENHPSWGGGTTLDRSGYVLRRVQKDGPYGYLIRAIQKRGKAGSDPTGYAPEHRIVMHDILGRSLRPGEVVDHIDGNRKNNEPANLRLFSSNSDHLKETLKGRVPNWTTEGRSRMTGRPPKNRAKESPPSTNNDHSRIDDRESPEQTVPKQDEPAKGQLDLF